MAFSPAFDNPTGRPFDFVVDAFGDVGGNTVSQKVVTAYDIYAPNELLALSERHNHSPGLRLMLKSMGFARGTAAPTTGHWEAPWRKNLVHVGSIVTPAGGVGNDIVIALDATSMYDGSFTASGSAVKASYPIEGELIRFPNGMVGRIKTKDTTFDPHRLTIEPISTTDDLDSAITAGQKYGIISNAWGEGTGLPKGRVPRISKYTNRFQIIKGASGATGSSLTNQTYFNPVEGKTGAFYLKVHNDMKWNFEENCNGALLFGKQGDNSTQLSSEVGIDVPVHTTEGLYTFVEDYGNSHGYTAGSFAIGDFDTIGNKLEDERVGTRHACFWTGKNLFNEIENAMLNSLDNDVAALLTKDLLNYTESMQPTDNWQPVSASEFALNIAFRGIRKGRFSYAFKMLHEFNFVQGMGSSLYSFPASGIVTPIGYTTDPVTTGKGCFIGYEYKKLGELSRETMPARIVGAGANFSELFVSDGFDRRTDALVAEISFHGACPNQMVEVTTV